MVPGLDLPTAGPIAALPAWAEGLTERAATDAEAALIVLLLSAADDEFMLGYRNSEWTGIAPMLEEDVAFSSMAQDEIGHARLLYEILGGRAGPERRRGGLQPPARQGFATRNCWNTRAPTGPSPSSASISTTSSTRCGWKRWPM